MTAAAPSERPVLLFDGECAVCRHIAHWVQRCARQPAGDALQVQAIGADPAALERICPGLSIWDAYATVHVLMPDGSVKLGGEAIAQVLRELPATRRAAAVFEWRLWGRRPFQAALDLAYLILADVRPLLGCESCGQPAPWLRPLMWLKHGAHRLLGHRPRALANATPHRPTPPGVPP